MSIFSPLKGARVTFKSLNERGNFSFFKHHLWNPKDLPTLMFSVQLCSVGKILVLKSQIELCLFTFLHAFVIYYSVQIKDALHWKKLWVSAFIQALKNCCIAFSGEKIDIIAEKSAIFCQNFQLQSALITEFATRWEVSHIWACSARRALSEYTSNTPGSFLELDPLDEGSGGEISI